MRKMQKHLMRQLCIAPLCDFIYSKRKCDSNLPIFLDPREGPYCECKIALQFPFLLYHSDSVAMLAKATN